MARILLKLVPCMLLRSDPGERCKSPSCSEKLRKIYGSANHTLSSFSKFRVPKPVTGSQPSTASNPAVPHPGFAPSTISFNAQGLAYNTGLMKPTGPFPFLIRSSLINVIMLPTVGAAAEVPPVKTHFPPTAMTVLRPLEETSGMPRAFLELLYLHQEVS